MVALHHEAMSKLLKARNGGTALGPDALMRAGVFFTESMSPFEMTHRAFAEANAALHHMNQTLEEELKRIAHALHDEAGQLLAAVHLSLDQVERELGPSAPAGLAVVKQHLDDVYQQLRHLSHELRPTVLDDLGLVPAIEFLAQGIAKRSGLRFSVQSSAAVRLPVSTETVLYRVVQEALNNIHKHAHAKFVKIQVRITDKIVKCLVSDDGVGFSPEGPKGSSLGRGLGLLGMREKLQRLGGALKIESAPGQGTRLSISVPRRD